MELIVKNANFVIYRNNGYYYNGLEVVDETCIHLFLNEGIYAVTLPCIVNEIEINSIEKFEEVFK